ncbi:MAG: hypothetical protein ACYCWW_11990, partial [Deltaproteobacteria bacterium]
MSAAAPESSKRELAWITPYVLGERRRLLAGVALVALTNGLQLSIPWLTKRAIDAITASRFPMAREVALAIAAIAIAQAIVRVFSRMALLDAGRHVEHAIRGDLFG